MDRYSICGQNGNWLEVEDVLANILSRVPVKSLMMCKSVCKHWQSIICSPFFIRLQLGWSRVNPTHIFLDGWGIDWTKLDAGKFEKILPPGSQIPRGCEMICSFNGLLFLTSDIRGYTYADLKIVIWNPATQEVVCLPQGTPSKRTPRLGIGFGTGVSEYKVFRIFYPTSQPKLEYCECEVYSSVTESWKSIGSVPYMPLYFRKHVSIDGRVHWFIPEAGREVPGAIFAVDLDENLTEIDLPQQASKRLAMLDFEGCLSLISLHDEVGRFDIWVLEQDNNTLEPSWVKKCSDKLPVPLVGCSFSVAACENEILLLSVDRIFVYDMGNRTWRELRRTGSKGITYSSVQGKPHPLQISNWFCLMKFRNLMLCAYICILLFLLTIPIGVLFLFAKIKPSMKCLCLLSWPLISST